jgi:guanylate kinase
MDQGNSGKTILVAGLYCAGKTTLIGACLEHIPELTYITTYTTRHPRPREREEGTHEYIFVNDQEYADIRRRPGWDHTELRGISYGSDAELVNNHLAQGQSFICVTTMYPNQIAEMRSRYHSPTALLLLNTKFEVCRARATDPESGRSNDYLRDPAQSSEQANMVRAMADYVYDPLGPLDDDMIGFTNLVKRILAS